MSSNTPRMRGETLPSRSERSPLIEAFSEGFDLNNVHNIPPISFKEFEPQRLMLCTLFIDGVTLKEDFLNKYIASDLADTFRELGKSCALRLAQLPPHTRLRHIMLCLKGPSGTHDDPLDQTYVAGWRAYIGGHIEFFNPSLNPYCWGHITRGGK